MNLITTFLFFIDNSGFGEHELEKVVQLLEQKNS